MKTSLFKLFATITNSFNKNKTGSYCLFNVREAEVSGVCTRMNYQRQKPNCSCVNLKKRVNMSFMSAEKNKFTLLEFLSIIYNDIDTF